MWNILRLFNGISQREMLTQLCNVNANRYDELLANNPKVSLLIIILASFWRLQRGGR